jgi:hypothetical protein
VDERSAAEYQLQAVAVGIAKIDAMIVAGPAANGNAVAFELAL